MAVQIIVTILLVGLVLIATENFNRMNKAAVAMFMGGFCWLLYIAYGATFVVSQHPVDFLSHLFRHPEDAISVKEFIANHLFLNYLVSAAEIVLFLLGTTTIVEVLNNNGCFDFIQEWLRTRSSKRFLWILAAVTFIISANLDNLTTVCLMLAVVHTMVADDRQRLVYGSVVVLAANCGGAFTVIGDVTTLSLWTNDLVTPTAFSGSLILPCLAALVSMLLLLQRMLPERISLMQARPIYRGDDTVLTRSQRLLMLFVGIGGLWFIPTFHRLTHLPPFVGALSVLSLLWIVNELCNRMLLGSEQMTTKRQPMVLQYTNIQNMLYFIGITLALGAVTETGAFEAFFLWLTEHLNDDLYIIASVMGLVSGAVNNVTAVLANISVFTQDLVQAHPDYETAFAQNGTFWPLLSFSSAMGGSLLTIGTMAGYALMRMEHVTLRWYLTHVTGKVFVGWIVGLVVFYFTAEYWY